MAVETPDPVRPYECGYCGGTHDTLRAAIDCCAEQFDAGGDV